MDAITLLRQDHEKVKGMLFEYERMPRAQPEEKRALAERILRELMVHERIEEEIFYPAFKEASRFQGEGEGEVEHAKEEHAEVDSLTEELEGLDVGDPRFDETFLEMKEKIEHHIRDEEEKMFPIAKRIMPAVLETLGRDMQEYKDALLRELKEGVKEQKRA